MHLFLMIRNIYALLGDKIYSLTPGFASALHVCQKDVYLGQNRCIGRELCNNVETNSEDKNLSNKYKFILTGQQFLDPVKKDKLI